MEKDVENQMDIDKLNSAITFEVFETNLPVFCPTKDMELWNTHPRVYIPMEQGRISVCPYCSSKFKLKKV